MPSDIGPVVAGIRRRTIAVGLVSSAQTDGAGCGLLGLVTGGGCLTASVGLAEADVLAGGRGTEYAGFAEATTALRVALFPGGAADTRNWSQALELPPSLI